jgi:hypothetical protein
MDCSNRLLISVVGSTAVWDFDDDRWTELLRQRAGRDLTTEESAECVGQRPIRATCIELVADG